MPKPGQIVRVKKGRDSGRYAVIVKVENPRFVWIADGDKRKFDKAKKKNILHLHFLNEESPEVINSLMETGRVTNGKLRYALKKYNAAHSEVQEKGE
ncbi:KOW domain-containing RNA-binding protein [Microaerobacter geothermalis]|nr:KOW domain-containing RNA-binding protein [Microaerobacter geothermalis]